MGSQSKQLIRELEKLVAILNTEGETHWYNWMLKSKNRLENSDSYGVEYLLSAYGGMGSFNDFILENQKSNRLLSKARNRAYQLASELQRGF